MKCRSEKIIATLGPACSSRAVLKNMFRHGVDAVRINTAHGTAQEYDSLVSLVKEVSPETPVLVDLKGPEIRFRSKGDVVVKKGTRLWFGFSRKDEYFFDKDFYKKVPLGKRVLFEDGKYSAKIVSKKNKRILLGFSCNAILKNNKGVNIPGVDLGLPAISRKDSKIISWAGKRGLSFFALSFCSSARDLKALRKKTGEDSILVAKIESRLGLKNYSEILSEADGVIVARGDLGAEVKKESIPLLQKKMVKSAVNEGKFCVVATQMLESMIENPFPTRAEINDIANSVLDGADCLMLSGETAIGANPAASVREMRLACEEVEEQVPNPVKLSLGGGVSDSITKTIHQLSDYLNVDRIVAFTKSGYTCQMISRFRSKTPVIGLTWSPRTRKLLSLYFGVFPVLLRKKQVVDSHKIISFLKSRKLLRTGETIILTGNKSGQEQHSNLIEVQKVT